MFGKSFAPYDEVRLEEWRNFGGYPLIPISVDDCAMNASGEKMKRWPPPGTMW